MNIQKFKAILKYALVICVGAIVSWNFSFIQPFSASYPPGAPYKVISYRNGEPDSVETAAGRQYYRTSFGEFWLGKHYRSIWTTPIKVKVLDLKREGLQITKRGGGMQTTSFTLEDKELNSYTLRSLDKDPITVIPAFLWRTAIGLFIRDQVSATDPFALVTVLHLTEKAGIASGQARLVFIRENNPEFRKFNLQKSGLFYLSPKYSIPTDLLLSKDREFNMYSTEGMLQSLERSGNRIDTISYLRCRLFDLLIGDWDRHAGQWDWVGFKVQSDTVFKPLPKDRDQAFGFYADGVFPYLLTREFAVRKITSLKPNYEDIAGFSQNGSALDNRFLKTVSFTRYKPIIRDLQNRLNDQVLLTAIAHYPRPILPLVASRLFATLKRRRDNLPKAADQYYQILKAKPDSE